MIIFVVDERTNHILQAFIAILVLGSENCRFQWTKTSANKRFYQNIYWNLNARRDIVLSAYWWMIRREPHPQPHLRFRRQNYYIFLNYASVIFFLPFNFLIYMRVTSYFCLYLLWGNYENRHKTFRGNYDFLAKKIRGQHDFSLKKFARYNYYSYLCANLRKTWNVYWLLLWVYSLF